MHSLLFLLLYMLLFDKLSNDEIDLWQENYDIVSSINLDSNSGLKLILIDVWIIILIALMKYHIKK